MIWPPVPTVRRRRRAFIHRGEWLRGKSQSRPCAWQYQSVRAGSLESHSTPHSALVLLQTRASSSAAEKRSERFGVALGEELVAVAGRHRERFLGAVLVEKKIPTSHTALHRAGTHGGGRWRRRRGRRRALGGEEMSFKLLNVK